MKGESEMQKWKWNWKSIVTMKYNNQIFERTILFWKKPSKREVYSYICNTGFYPAEIEVIDIKIIKN